MSKPTKSYQGLIRNLEVLKDHCEEMAMEDRHPCSAWKQDAKDLQEAMDIISDYEKMTSDSSRMIKHYETSDKPIRRSGVWCCPNCGKRTQYNHTHCHWCGKKIGWGK